MAKAKARQRQAQGKAKEVEDKGKAKARAKARGGAAGRAAASAKPPGLASAARPTPRADATSSFVRQALLSKRRPPIYMIHPGLRWQEMRR